MLMVLLQSFNITFPYKLAQIICYFESGINIMYYPLLNDNIGDRPLNWTYNKAHLTFLKLIYLPYAHENIY